MGDAKRTCTARNKFGNRCGNLAELGSDLCFTHAGKRDMKALGRAGGVASGRSRRGISPGLVDDDLRSLAKRELERLVKSDDEKTRLSAAKSLFSYGATPPSDGKPSGGTPASLQYDFAAIRLQLEEYGVIRYRPGSDAENARLLELGAEVKTLQAENAKLRDCIAELEASG